MMDVSEFLVDTDVYNQNLLKLVKYCNTSQIPFKLQGKIYVVLLRSFLTNIPMNSKKRKTLFSCMNILNRLMYNEYFSRVYSKPFGEYHVIIIDLIYIDEH